MDRWEHKYGIIYLWRLLSVKLYHTIYGPTLLGVAMNDLALRSNGEWRNSSRSLQNTPLLSLLFTLNYGTFSPLTAYGSSWPGLVSSRSPMLQVISAPSRVVRRSSVVGMAGLYWGNKSTLCSCRSLLLLLAHLKEQTTLHVEVAACLTSVHAKLTVGYHQWPKT